jgi:hypothetical protein
MESTGESQLIPFFISLTKDSAKQADLLDISFFPNLQTQQPVPSMDWIVEKVKETQWYSTSKRDLRILKEGIHTPLSLFDNSDSKIPRYNLVIADIKKTQKKALNGKCAVFIVPQVEIISTLFHFCAEIVWVKGKRTRMAVWKG